MLLFRNKIFYNLSLASAQQMFIDSEAPVEITLLNNSPENAGGPLTDNEGGGGAVTVPCPSLS